MASIVVATSPSIGRYVAAARYIEKEEDIVLCSSELAPTTAHASTTASTSPHISGIEPPSVLILLLAPTVFSIQIARDLHAEVPSPVAFTAHSCSPNSAVVWHGADVCSLHAAVAAAIGSGERADILPAAGNHQIAGLVAPCEFQIGLRAATALREGDIVTFDYCTTEWDMAAPFECACKAPSCRGLISGFAPLCKLNPAAAAALLPLCTPFIRSRALSELGQLLLPHLPADFPLEEQGSAAAKPAAAALPALDSGVNSSMSAEGPASPAHLAAGGSDLPAASS